MRHLLTVLIMISVLDAKVELDECLSVARLNLTEDDLELYWDDQPSADQCFETYQDAVDGK